MRARAPVGRSFWVAMSAWFFASLAVAAPGTKAPAAPAPKTLQVLCLGDSVTEGYQLEREQAYPALIEAALHAEGKTNISVLNAGISGATSASAVPRLKWHLKATPKPNVLVLALGANDGLRGLSVSEAKQNLSKAITLAQENGMKVLLAGMQMPPNYGKQYTEDFARLFPDLAKETGVALIPFLLEGVAGDPKLNLGDGIHPNVLGHKIVAATVLKYLEPLL